MALTREEVAARYGTALFAYAQDMNSLDTVYADLRELYQAVSDNPQILKVLSDPILNSLEKKKSLSAIEQSFTKEVQAFLNLLLEYNHFSDLLEIINYFNELYNSSKKIMEGTAISAVELNDAQLGKIAKSCAQKYNFSQVKLHNEVDKSIIGGVILKIDDKVIDGSVKNRLKKIRAQLIKKD